MCTQIYLVRHGQSTANAKNLYIGHADYDLTDLGHMQADMVADYFKDIKVDVIYSSDLLRAYNTALHTAKAKGLEVIKDKNFREIYAGEWEEMDLDLLKVKYEKDYGVWLNNIGRARCTGGESVEELQNRISAEAEKVMRENTGKTILVFTHATPLKVLRAAWDRKTLDEMKDLPWAPNASVTRGEYKDGEFRITDYGIYDFLGEHVTQLGKNV